MSGPAASGEHVPASDDPSERPGSRATERDEPRHLTDPRELRAVTHPVRLSLLEVLELHGALTATDAGELIGESPTTCSFHLRQLAKYGFVEEAGGGAGRRRPWQLVARGMRINPSADDPEMSIAATALESLLVKRWMDRFSEWERTRSHYAPDWQEAGTAAETVTYVTPAELSELMDEIFAVLRRYEERRTDAAARPEESRPVEVVTFAFPFDLVGPGRGSSGRPPSIAPLRQGARPDEETP